MTTAHTKIQEKEYKWHHIDADGKVLGRVAASVAKILNGKEDPQYSPNFYMKDKVVVTNVKNITTTGNKEIKKVYFWHTGFPKGLRSETYGKRFERDPEKTFRKAVEGMLPKNKLRKVKMSNLYVYLSSEHPHQGQITK